MKKKIYMLLGFLIIFSTLFAVSHQSSKTSLDNYAYCIAIGFDTSENSKLKISFQIPLLSGGSSSDSSSEQSTSSIVNTVECESIDSGINLMNAYIAQQLDFSHCKAIIFSEESAKNGVSNVINTLMNKVEISSDCLIVVSRGNASALLEESVSSLENASARYYDASITSAYSTGYTQKVTINDFYTNLKDNFVDPYASLSAINSESSQIVSQSNSSSSVDSSNKAGESQTSSDSGESGSSSSSSQNTSNDSAPNSYHPENLGLAVFKNDKLVGELNGLETVCHLLVTGKLESYNLTIPNPDDTSKTLDLHITLKKQPKINLKIVNGTPYIDIDINLTGRILSVDSNYITTSNIEKIEHYENACSYFLTKQIENYLYRTSKEFNSDIVGFGKYALQRFLTNDDWTAYNWPGNYKNAFFNIHVDTNIKSGYLLMNS